MTTSSNPLSGRRFQDESGNPVVPGQKLGEGGEGVVHLVDDDPGSVVKIWHPGRTPQDAAAKISHLVSHPVKPGLGVTWHITWPQHEVRESGIIVGYTMPTLNPGESWEPIVEYYNRRAAQGTGAAQAREIQIDDRVRMARNLALGFNAVHDAGYVIGDVNEKNVEVNRQNDIAMVDCDSYGFTDSATGRSFSNGMGRPEFQAPEAQGDYANRTQNHDRFGLAVVIFHLLTGYHPYTVTNRPNVTLPGDRISAWLFPPADPGLTAPAPYNEAWDTLTDKQKELFLRCFDRAHKDDPRPTPEEWVQALLEMPAVPAPSPSQSPSPSPSPAPGRTPRPSPSPAPGPRRYYTPSGSLIDDWPLWLSAVAGYAALLPLTLFGQFRPFWWVALLLMAGLFFYFPVRRLLQSPITRQRWIVIGFASIVSIWFLLGLIGAAISVWPWWLWLGLGVGAAFIFLVPARSQFSSSNARRRYAAIGAASLLGLFILVGMGAAGYREWQDWSFERSLQEANNAGSANVASAAGGGAAAVPLVVPTDSPAPVSAAAPVATDTPEPTPTPVPTDTPEPTPTPVPTNTPEPTATPELTPTPPPTVVVAPTPAPVLIVSRDVANPGESVDVELSGFLPDTRVKEISIAGIDFLGDLTITTDPQGYLTIDDIVVPNLPAGFHDVRVTVGVQTVIHQLTVLAIPPTPTPPPYPDPVLLEQRGLLPSQLARAPGVDQHVSGCFVGNQLRQQRWIYLADRPSATVEDARSPILLEFSTNIPKEELREVIPGECYYVGPITYQTNEQVPRCPGTVYDAGCGKDSWLQHSFHVYLTEGTLQEITEAPQFGN